MEDIRRSVFSTPQHIADAQAIDIGCNRKVTLVFFKIYIFFLWIFLSWNFEVSNQVWKLDLEIKAQWTESLCKQNKTQSPEIQQRAKNKNQDDKQTEFFFKNISNYRMQMSATVACFPF